MKVALVCGAGGFIGGHLCKRLKSEGYYVVGVDLKYNEYWPDADKDSIGDMTLDGYYDKFYVADLRETETVRQLINKFSPQEIYQLAADMGGAGYIFSGDHDADVMHNSCMINLNVLDAVAHHAGFECQPLIFYSSSACIYPEHNQLDPNNPNCEESSAYPADPDSEYGWEKLFSERLYHSYMRNYGLKVRIARFHNVFGPEGSWNNGKEKSPAAITRKVLEAGAGGDVEIWGDGEQTRSFLYIDECLDGVRKLMQSECTDVLNIGSDEMISINNLAYVAADIAGHEVNLTHVDGPLGVRGRCSHNDMIEDKLGWRPTRPLREGLEKLSVWIKEQMNE
jgi:nucleoside-diphosphate-sugar epimerase